MWNLRWCLAAFVSMLSFVAVARAAAPCEPVVGHLVSVQGLVEVQRVSEAQWAQAGLDDALCQGDTLRAAERSRAAVMLINDAVLRVDESSTIKLTDISASEEKSSLLSLIKGAFQSFSRKPRSLEVDTPYLNGSIEGTEFVFRVTDDRTELTVFEGVVRASNEFGSVSVAPGQAVSAEAGQAPQPRTVVRPRDAAQWALYYPPVLAAAGGGKATTEDLPAPVREALEQAGRGKTTEAFAALDAVAEQDRDARFHLSRAALLLSVGRVEEARGDIDRALEQDSGAALAFALRAVIEVVQNDTEKALDDARQAVSLSPDAAAPRIALSYAQQARFQIAEARQTLLECVERQPQDALAWARLAELWLMDGRRGRAIEAAEKASSLAPDLERTQISLGFAALAQFRTAEAREAFERAITLDSADPLPRLGLGLSKIGAGKLTEGRKDLEVAVGLDGNNALLRAYLGKAYFEEKRSPLDQEQFEMAKQLDPADPTAFLYDGIRKQTQNRPVEAVRDLEDSVELNDNRATYRSRLLLDKDRAARGTSLARAYNDLGFSSLGINESTASLTLDPSNASAHRFLSDTYGDVPRREISRVSELLQAQLMQDININPVQPSVSETNLNVVTAGGPADVGFNEFTPLFQRNRPQVNLSGFGGDDQTSGGELVASGLYKRLSLSVGGFAYDTAGFRPNDDLHHDVYNAYAQVAVTQNFNLQAEYTHRETESGDIIMKFDPEDFFDSLRRDFEVDTTRLGARISPDPSSDVLVSLITTDRSETGSVSQDLLPGVILNTKTQTDEEGDQAEAQYLFRGKSFNLTAGLAYAKVDQSIVLEQEIEAFGLTFPQPTFFSEPTLEDRRGYVYANIESPGSLTFTLGLSYQKYEEPDFGVDFNRTNPKVGIRWDPIPALTVRGAYFKVIKPALASNRTLEPTQVAGFNQFFDDANATRAERYCSGIDWRVSKNGFLGFELTRREFDQPVLDQSTGVKVFEDREEMLHHLYAYWTVTDRVSLTGEATYDKYEAVSVDPNRPRRLRNLFVPVRAQYFHPTGFFGGISVNYVDQELARQGGLFQTQAEGQSNFTTVDVALGYRNPKRWGSASVTVMNLFDRQFNFQDDSFRTFQDEASVSRYTPETTVMLRVTVNF